MDDLSIERLVLEVPGLGPEDARELARLVGAQLAGATGPRGRFGTLRVAVDAALADASPERLAPLVVAALRRQIG